MAFAQLTGRHCRDCWRSDRHSGHGGSLWRSLKAKAGELPVQRVRYPDDGMTILLLTGFGRQSTNCRRDDVWRIFAGVGGSIIYFAIRSFLDIRLMCTSRKAAGRWIFSTLPYAGAVSAVASDACIGAREPESFQPRQAMNIISSRVAGDYSGLTALVCALVAQSSAPEW